MIVHPGWRIVTGFDRRSLYFGSASVSIAKTRTMTLLNPTGALRPTNPMNLAGFDKTGRLIWALPVDGRRLETAKQTAKDSLLFKAAWSVLDTVLKAPTKGPGRIFGVTYSVGDPVEIGYHRWVEYRGPRPWLELAPIRAHLVIAGAPKSWRLSAALSVRLSCGGRRCATRRSHLVQE